MEKAAKRKNYRRRSRLLFYSIGLSLPVLQFCIFYIYTNFNSFLLAFQDYEARRGALGYEITFAGFANFKTAALTIGNNLYMLKNSFIMFLCSTLLGITLALVFSFYMYKKNLGSGFFKVLLFLPQLVSHVVFALLFTYLVNDLLPWVVEETSGKSIDGLFYNMSARFPTTLFFNLWIGFGVNVMLFSGAMSGINPSIVESAQLDGVNLVQEFIHISVPMIFPTIITFLVTGLAGIFTNQMNLYSLFGDHASELSTLGYFLYVNTSHSDIIPQDAGYLSYSEISALGLLLTAIVFPITFGTRKLLEKYGPSVN